MIARLLIATVAVFVLIFGGQWFLREIPNLMWDLSTPIVKIMGGCENDTCK